MDRKKFIKNCGFGCLAASGLSMILPSCSNSRNVIGDIDGSHLVIPISHFKKNHRVEDEYLTSVVVQHSRLKYPICVFRNENGIHSAILMKCSHQGAELQVFGDKLQCPAHGSEFNQNGLVMSAPADTNLRTFDVIVEKELIKIPLR